MASPTHVKICCKGSIGLDWQAPRQQEVVHVETSSRA
jgi:hypothetical protein